MAALFERRPAVRGPLRPARPTWWRHRNVSLPLNSTASGAWNCFSASGSPGRPNDSGGRPGVVAARGRAHRPPQRGGRSWRTLRGRRAAGRTRPVRPSRACRAGATGTDCAWAHPWAGS